MYYQTPSEEIFNDMKQAAIKVWKTKDNTHRHVNEKIEIVNAMKNYRDNAMICYNMFDHIDQRTFLQHLSDPAKEYITENY
jgi:hypothetical protein